MIADRWEDAEERDWVLKAGDDAADQALARRVYSSRLIGSDPDLVMHGGGNTSIKLDRPDLFGVSERVHGAARALAELDLTAGLAELAVTERWARPKRRRGLRTSLPSRRPAGRVASRAWPRVPGAGAPGGTC